MKNYCVRFSKIDSDEDFRKFSKEIDGEAEVTDDVIKASGSIARGLIKKIHLDTGFYMRAWNLVFTQPVNFCKQAIPADINDNSFRIIYILTPGSCLIKH